MCQCSSVNLAAFTTVSVLSLGTGLSVAAAVANTATTVALVAYSVLAITFAGLSIASVTAFLHEKSVDASSYLENFKNQAGYAVGAMYTFVAQTLVQALVQGLAQGVSTKVRRAIAGDDITISQKTA
jgi:hypothetical protein